MYIKHVFSWIFCYHGMHIVQKVRKAHYYLKQYQRLLFTLTTMSMILNKIFTFFFQEWERKDMTSYVTYVVLYTSLTFNIFILCYIGELVAEKVKF